LNQRLKIAVGLGTNLGDRAQMLTLAATALAEDLLENAHCSSVYETNPVGLTEQPLFLNAVMTGTTEWKPPAILNFLKTLERNLGRVPGILNGPRLIDLDLLIYGETEWHSEGIEVPHPRLVDREFVLAPLIELWPEWRHPVLGKSSLELYSALSAKTAVKRPYQIGQFRADNH
jgi:2-amino-4-hydroxy-6-hydroxymethyldihydropteridine diphosphokinase